jgi:hypothetical protein
MLAWHSAVEPAHDAVGNTSPLQPGERGAGMRVDVSKIYRSHRLHRSKRNAS